MSAGGQRQTDWKNQRLRFCELQRSKWLRESHERDERWVSSHRLSLQLLLQGICYHPGTLTVLSLSVFVQGSTLVAVPSNWGRACGRTATLKWFARNKKRRRNWASDSFQQVCVFVCGLKARLWDHDPVHGLITFCFPSKIKPIFLRCLLYVMCLHCIHTDCHCNQFILNEAVVQSPFGLENYWRDFTIMIWCNIQLNPLEKALQTTTQKLKRERSSWQFRADEIKKITLTAETQAYVWMFLLTLAQWKGLSMWHG